MRFMFAFTAMALASLAAYADGVRASAEYPEFYNGDSEKGNDHVQSIKVLAPRLGSNVKGDVTIVFEAPGMSRALARCWTHGDAWGRDAVLADIQLGAHARDVLEIVRCDLTLRLKRSPQETQTLPAAAVRSSGVAGE